MVSKRQTCGDLRRLAFRALGDPYIDAVCVFCVGDHGNAVVRNPHLAHDLPGELKHLIAVSVEQRFDLATHAMIESNTGGTDLDVSSLEKWVERGSA